MPSVFLGPHFQAMLGSIGVRHRKAVWMRCDLDFNEGWRFHLGDLPGAHEVAFADGGWRLLRLPHDWSVEQSFTREKAGGSTAFLPGGIGWYRKSFRMPTDARDRVSWIEFDGIYSNAEVWINGHYLGMRPYGYIPFSYELTPALNFGDEPNVLVVKADRTAYLDCRWYPGSGIYRNVRLVTVSRLHIPQWGTFISTPEANQDWAEVLIRTVVCNREDDARTVILHSTIYDDHEAEVGRVESGLTLAAGESEEVEQRIRVEKPHLWEIEAPCLYSVNSTVGEGRESDGCRTMFGIRDIRFDKDAGFFLNGTHRLLKGVCLHHDAGCVGAAVPPGVWERRLRLLKALGCNAIRTAHNPPSSEFLDLCDRMGFLVQAEAFDEWDYPKDKRHNYNQRAEEAETLGYTRFFGAWGETDIRAMVLRDRNHPSVIMWSLGNEIEWTYPGYEKATGYWDTPQRGDYYLDEPPNDDATLRRVFAESPGDGPALTKTAARLAVCVRELDASRPVTANMVLPSVSSFSGFADVQDVVGYSYRQCVYDYCRKRYADKMVLGAENWAQWSEWKPVLEKDYLAGIFLWTGIDYLGESREWPLKASTSGLIDLAGFPKPKYHYFRSLWSDQEVVHLAATPLSNSNYRVDESGTIVERVDRPRETMWQWPELHEHWNFTPGEEIYLEGYSNCDEVALFLNDRPMGAGRPEDSEDRILRWVVPFEPGALRAVGRETCVELNTSGEAGHIALECDRTEMCAGSRDVIHAVVQLVDRVGHPVRDREATVHFQIDGDATILGVDNGAGDSVQDYRSDTCRTANGRCLIILQAGDIPGEVTVSIRADGCTPVLSATLCQKPEGGT